MATLTGLSAGSHFGFGKGVGALVGGVLRDQTSTSMSFRSGVHVCGVKLAVLELFIFISINFPSSSRSLNIPYPTISPNTPLLFRIFGIAAFITGVFYAIFQALVGKKIDRKTLVTHIIHITSVNSAYI